MTVTGRSPGPGGGAQGPGGTLTKVNVYHSNKPREADALHGLLKHSR